LFDRLRTEKPDALQKVTFIQGDVLLEEMGLSLESKARLQEEVSVVFHFAATLRLEAKLKDSVEMNMTGTWRVLQLARGMTHLKVCLHDSMFTANLLYLNYLYWFLKMHYFFS
jgi:fatty acyl-CoA reductase